MKPSTAMPRPELLWSPTLQQMECTRLADYLQWLGGRLGLNFPDYESLWRWSINQTESFWQSIWDFFEIRATGSPDPVLTAKQMPAAQWFANTRLNYAEHVFRCATPDRLALITRTEGERDGKVGWDELVRDTSALAATLRRLGIGSGDRVVSCLPNRSESVVALLACASIGAVWSACSPTMNVGMIVDRFRQIEPALLIATDSFRYNGQVHDRAQEVTILLQELASIRQVIHVPGPLSAPATKGRASSLPDSLVSWRDCLGWHEATRHRAQHQFEHLPFAHPLWIDYLSGPATMAEAIVHGHGASLLSQLKTMVLQQDFRSGDCVMLVGSAAGIACSQLVAGLLAGATVVLYDGSPTSPDARDVWQFIDRHHVDVLGCDAAFLEHCMNAELRPGDFAQLGALRAVCVNGSPLSRQAYRWVYDAVKRDIWLGSISVGGDLTSGFAACAPILPVYAGEIQCRELGAAAFAFNEDGHCVIDEVGALVVTQPLPSMPVSFWNDPDMKRYQQRCFERFPGYWCHGERIRFTARGTSIVDHPSGELL